MEELVPSKGCCAFEPVIDRPRQLVSQDRQGFALARFFLAAGQRALPRCMVAQEERRRFGKGPLEVAIAAFFTRGAHAFARGCLGTLDQATIGDNILHAGATSDRVDVVAQHQAQELADTEHGLSQGQRGDVMGFGRLDHREF